MLMTTPDPNRFTFAYADWNPQHAGSKTGEGNRTELHGMLEFTGHSIQVLEISEIFYTRDTPIFAWEHTFTRSIENDQIREAAVAAGIWADLFSLFPLEFRR